MMEVFSYTKEQLEHTLDIAKAITIKGLVSEGLITFEKAEELSKNTTIILRKKKFFQTISDMFKKEKEIPEKHYLLFVKLTQEKSN